MLYTLVLVAVVRMSVAITEIPGFSSAASCEAALSQVTADFAAKDGWIHIAGSCVPKN